MEILRFLGAGVFMLMILALAIYMPLGIGYMFWSQKYTPDDAFPEAMKKMRVKYYFLGLGSIFSITFTLYILGWLFIQFIKLIL